MDSEIRETAIKIRRYKYKNEKKELWTSSSEQEIVETS